MLHLEAGRARRAAALAALAARRCRCRRCRRRAGRRRASNFRSKHGAVNVVDKAQQQPAAAAAAATPLRGQQAVRAALHARGARPAPAATAGACFVGKQRHVAAGLAAGALWLRLFVDVRPLLRRQRAWERA